jgi:hypothetical protein
MAETSSQPMVGAERPRLDRADRHAEPGTDLRMRQRLEVLKPHDLTLEWWQLVDCLAHGPHIEAPVHAVW